MDIRVGDDDIIRLQIFHCIVYAGLVAHAVSSIFLGPQHVDLIRMPQCLKLFPRIIRGAVVHQHDGIQAWIPPYLIGKPHGCGCIVIV